jgi:hypothetical protein
MLAQLELYRPRRQAKTSPHGDALMSVGADPADSQVRRTRAGERGCGWTQ